MKPNSRLLTFGAVLAFFLTFALAAPAQEAPQAAEKSAPPTAVTPPAETPAPRPATPPTPPASGDAKSPELRRLDTPAAPGSSREETSESTRGNRRGNTRRLNIVTTGGSPVISIGHDAHLDKGEHADAVIAVAGSATSEGEVSDAVVSIIGNTRVTGTTGDSAVAVLGSTYVNSKVGGEVVAVMGNVELGPEAEVGGDVVAVGGKVTRDPKAIVHGQVTNVRVGPVFAVDALQWLSTWVKECLFYGRLLWIGPHLGWAWAVALSFLFFYLILALIFRSGVEKCLTTFETRPGSSIMAALLTILLSPVLIVLLAVTVVGAALVPFIAVALLIASLFGKAVMLAWLGRRFTKFFGDGPLNHPVFAVLVGGILVMGLYMIPVVGIITYKLLKILGLGVVVYTLVQTSRREKAAAAAAAAVAAAAARPVPAPIPVAATIPPLAVVAGDPAGSYSAPPIAPPVAPRQVPASTLPRAGFWLRTGALLLDVILIGIVTGMIHEILPRHLEPQGPQLLLLGLAAYGAIMWKLKGTTIGGIVCGLRVVRADGREIDWATAIVRALGCFLSLVVVGLGFFWVVIDDEKQSWHDKIAGTAVVRMPRGFALV